MHQKFESSDDDVQQVDTLDEQLNDLHDVMAIERAADPWSV